MIFSWTLFGLFIAGGIGTFIPGFIYSDECPCLFPFYFIGRINIKTFSRFNRYSKFSTIR